MIDLHSHIIAGIDDGARSLTDSVALAKNSVAAGVTHIVCTPHIHFGVFNNNVGNITQAFEQTKAAIHEANIPLKLAFGCEVRASQEILNLVSQQKLPFIGKWGTQQALLLELPHSHIPAGIDNLIRWLLRHSVRPIIPHPERNRDILSNYAKAKWLQQLGCIFQVTAGAFVGRFSKKVEQTAWQLLEDGLISYIASDIHSIKNRPNDMLLAHQAITQRYDLARANCLTIDVPKNITAETNWQ